MDEPPYPLTLDPVGQPPVTGPPDRHVSKLDCGRINHIQNGPEGSSVILDTASQTSSNVAADRLNIGTVDRVATSIGATPSSDSGVHSWKEQWENMSELSSDDASGQPVQPNWSSPKRGYMSDIRTGPSVYHSMCSDICILTGSTAPPGVALSAGCAERNDITVRDSVEGISLYSEELEISV